MRVVHVVCSTGFAGVERYLVNVASGLADAGDDVIVIGGAADRMPQALAGSGARWLPGDSMRGALASLRSVESPDIVHTHMSQGDLVGWLARRPGRRRALQVSTRHFAGPRGGRPVVRTMLKRLEPALAAQIAISRYVAQYVEAPVDVVYTGVPDAAESTASRAPYVFAAQRLEPEKCTSDIVEAWAASRGPAAGWTLRIAGDGSERAALEALARERGVAGSVEFLGHRDDIPALLDAAGVVIAPTPREGLGIFVLEAMAHGAPVVASAGGGHLETVGVAAPELLFEPRSASAAAQVLDRLFADPVLRADAGTRLRRLQRDVFTVDRQVAETRAVYERVLEAR